MATRKRIRTTFVQAGGGGGAPPTVANLLWGPDFGEGSNGSDDKTWTVGVNVDLDAIDLTNEKTVGVNIDLDAVDLTNDKTVGVNIDLDSVDVENNKTVGVNIELDAIDLENNKSVGVNLDLDSIDLENTKTVGVCLSGEVIGGPFWMAISAATNSTAGTSIAVTAPAGTAVGDFLLVLVGGSSTLATLAITPPAGWTQIRNDNITGAVARHSAYSFWKFAASGDLPPSSLIFTYSDSADQGATIECHRMIGVDSSSPTDSHQGATGLATDLDADPSAPALAPTSFDNVIVFAWLYHPHAALSQSHTPPASHLERSDFQSTITAVITGSTSASRYFTAAGSAVAAAEFNCTETVATDFVTQRLTIKPGAVIIATC